MSKPTKAAPAEPKYPATHLFCVASCLTRITSCSTLSTRGAEWFLEKAVDVISESKEWPAIAHNSAAMAFRVSEFLYRQGLEVNDSQLRKIWEELPALFSVFRDVRETPPAARRPERPVVVAGPYRRGG